MLAATRSEPDDSPSGNLEGIFRQYQAQIFSAAFRVTGSPQDAEDVLQTVFLRLLRRRDALDLSPSPGAYLHRAAVNAAIDLMRIRSRSQSIPFDELTVEPTGGQLPDPAQQQQDREIRQRLRAAVLELSPKSAEIFCLRFFEGFSNLEIARMLDMSQIAVGVTLHRARNLVKQVFARS